ncbi:MAG: nitroreductase family protein [Candidatus Bathyarchaeota archaeon]|nr:nitroreductase family protein [Candidatus Bathyarchaeota archaeon]
MNDLATHAALAASCNNYQPWRYVFVYEKDQLEKMWTALSRGNKWVELASMIIAVFSREEDDCVIRSRVYHHFDVGMATAHLILRATELGLVAHPIAGFKPKRVREVLGIPDEYQVITLVNVGKKSPEIHPYLTEEQAGREKERPKRKPLNEFAFHNKYSG